MELSFEEFSLHSAVVFGYTLFSLVLFYWDRISLCISLDLKAVWCLQFPWLHNSTPLSPLESWDYKYAPTPLLIQIFMREFKISQAVSLYLPLRNICMNFLDHTFVTWPLSSHPPNITWKAHLFMHWLYWASLVQLSFEPVDSGIEHITIVTFIFVVILEKLTNACNF